MSANEQIIDDISRDIQRAVQEMLNRKLKVALTVLDLPDVALIMHSTAAAISCGSLTLLAAHARDDVDLDTLLDQAEAGLQRLIRMERPSILAAAAAMKRGEPVTEAVRA